MRGSSPDGCECIGGAPDCGWVIGDHGLYSRRGSPSWIGTMVITGSKTLSGDIGHTRRTMLVPVARRQPLPLHVSDGPQ
jgi:hypothetical protein